MGVSFIIHFQEFSFRQVYLEIKTNKWGVTESFSDIDLSLISGKLGGMMGVTNDETKVDAMYLNGKNDLKVKLSKNINCAPHYLPTLLF